MRAFKYDIVQLIESIRDRPCLWDKTVETYRDRTERRTAWEEVFGLLDSSYGDMSDEKKRFTEEHIINKWTNVRDTFIKTLKTKMGKPKKKYVLYNHLKFLIKDGACDSQDEQSIEGDVDETPPQIEMKIEKIESPPDTSYSRKRSKRMEHKEESKRIRHDKSDIEFAEVDEYNDPRVMNEDEAFFASLLPSVVNYSEDERLEFRIEVLALMKKIKDKRKWLREVSI